MLNLIVTFGKGNISLILCNTSHVDSGNQYDTDLQQQAKNKVMIYMSDKHSFITNREFYVYSLLQIGEQVT